MGLKLLHPLEEEPSSKIEADIILLHGLGGDSVRTWTHPKSKAFWPMQFLPQNLPRTRIFSYDYNADPFLSSSTAGVRTHAKGLLSSIIDERDDNDARSRPIIFIAHSLGGIIVKQALVQASNEPLYKDIHQSTIGLIFMGTPHRGSDLAGSGKLLSNIANAVVNKPSSKVLEALKANSDELQSITDHFRSQYSQYHIVSFYETSTTAPFKEPVVPEHSAILGIESEDQVPIEANHSEICRFDTEGNDAYKKVWKRTERIMKKGKRQDFSTGAESHKPINRHYTVPYSQSTFFTRRDDLCQRLDEFMLSCSDPHSQTPQRRFLLHGLGGIGKTQLALWFTQKYRESFWGVFWVDASSQDRIEVGFQDILDACQVRKDPRMVPRWLSGLQEPWLLIFDNADDPQLDLSAYFPPGSRGSVIITSRNPECSAHAPEDTHEVSEMTHEEGVQLLIKTARLTVMSDRDLKEIGSLVDMLGKIALAITQAGALIRSKLSSVETYRQDFKHQFRQLLEFQPAQGGSDYDKTVWSTWELSLDKIGTMGSEGRNAVDLLSIFSFWHFDGIFEGIFSRAWDMNRKRAPEHKLPNLSQFIDCDKAMWDPTPFKTACRVLASFSLIRVEDQTQTISMHPLTHEWARRRMNNATQAALWRKASRIIASSCHYLVDDQDLKHETKCLAHANTCFGIDSEFLQQMWGGEPYSSIIAHDIAIVYSNHGQYKKSARLAQCALDCAESRQEQNVASINLKTLLANNHRMLGDLDHALACAQESSALSRRYENSAQDGVYLNALSGLVRALQEKDEIPQALAVLEPAMKRARKKYAIDSKVLRQLVVDQAQLYSKIGDYENAKSLLQDILTHSANVNAQVLSTMYNLAKSYYGLGELQEALNIQEKCELHAEELFGDDHPMTLPYISQRAFLLEQEGRLDEALPIAKDVLARAKLILDPDSPDLDYHQNFYSEIAERQPNTHKYAEDPEVEREECGTEGVDGNDPPNDGSLPHHGQRKRKRTSITHGAKRQPAT